MSISNLYDAVQRYGLPVNSKGYGESTEDLMSIEAYRNALHTLKAIVDTNRTIADEARIRMTAKVAEYETDGDSKREKWASSIVESRTAVVAKMNSLLQALAKIEEHSVPQAKR